MLTMEDSESPDQNERRVSDKQRTPLTLEFSPADTETEGEPYVVIEPSFEHGGHIFMGVHPLGLRVGCHLTETEARTIRDHLTKLLHEKPEPEPEGTNRPKPKKQRRKIGPLIRFRIEFKTRKVEGIISKLK